MVHHNQKKTVIFDLGNVMLDWDIEQVLDSLAFDKTVTDQLREELFYHHDWQDMDHGKLSEPDVTSRICSRSSLDRTTVEKALLAAKNSLAPIEKSEILINEIYDQGIQIYCLSNMSRETYAHIKGYAFFGLFSGIVISGIEGCKKPDDAIFHLILDRFELKPSQTLFIDDTLSNIETAMRMGLHVQHFKRDDACYASIRKFVFG